MKMKSCVPLLLAALVMVVAAGPGEKGKKPDLVDLELTGTVVSEQVEKKGKDGEARTITVYYLKSEDKKIHLPQPRAKKKGEEPAIKLVDYVNANVKIKVKGFTRESKKGGKQTYVHLIASIERVQA